MPVYLRPSYSLNSSYETDASLLSLARFAEPVLAFTVVLLPRSIGCKGQTVGRSITIVECAACLEHGGCMEERSETGQQLGRVIVAIALLALIVAYTWGVVSGGIDANRRIDATHMVAIVVVGVFCAALLSPKLLSRIKTLELKGFK